MTTDAFTLTFLASLALQTAWKVKCVTQVQIHFSSCSLSWLWSIDSHTFLFSCIYFSSILIFPGHKKADLGCIHLLTLIWELQTSVVKTSNRIAQSDIWVCLRAPRSSFWPSSSPLPSPFLILRDPVPLLLSLPVSPCSQSLITVAFLTRSAETHGEDLP